MHRQRDEDEQRYGERDAADNEQVRLGVTDRTTQRFDADPSVAGVSNDVERPGEGREEPDVEDLQDDQ
jgi:hypothetical protein